ncbi:MAG TPA: hypothetical protein VK153_02890 [Candidatus Paceibacterota bacterium]|nr:hypothetical protein [Candidatus Paceibacterota bacterium]
MGTEAPSNISYLKGKIHKAWHVLVGNMNALQICDFLNHIEFKPENINITCVFINGTPVILKGKNNSKNPTKIRRAWETLFKGLEFKDAIAYINNQLLDPSYHLYLEEIKK